ncbi:hypothetical protein NMG60_11029996 [Bertholletia excelsa]
MLGIISASLLILLYHLVVVKYCIRRVQRIAASRDGRMAVGDAPEPGTGVDEKVLATIPIVNYKATKVAEQDECAVCLGELEEGEVVRLLPACRHPFHVSCIDQWFMAHSSCPLCRSPVVAPPEASPPEAVEVGVVADVNEGSEVGSSGRDSSCDLLRPRTTDAAGATVERWPRGVVAGLSRSLSMDRSFLVVEVESEGRETTSSSSKAMLTRGGSCRDRPMMQLDRVSSKLLSSFSRLRMGGVGAGNGALLPY